MSDQNSHRTSTDKGTIVGIGAAFVVIAGTVFGCNSYKIVPAQSYGVDIKFGQLESDHLKPGIYPKVPFFEKIYTLNNNTIIMETDGVGAGNNSSDQNAVTADFRIHYKVNPKVGSIALNIEKITDNHGQGLIKDLEGQALNAAVGSRPATDTLADPVGFLKAFKENLEWRIGQNNVPAEIDSIELLTMYVGASSSSSSSTTPNGLRKVMQLRIKANDEVEQMSGPAAVSVSAAGIVNGPGSITVLKPSSDAGPTTPTGPLKQDNSPRVQP